MELWLRPLLGGEGSTHGSVMLYDTGSSMLTTSYTDLAQLGNTPMYYGWSPDTSVVNANGATDSLPSLWVEIRFVESASWVLWGSWIVGTGPDRASRSRG